MRTALHSASCRCVRSCVVLKVDQRPVSNSAMSLDSTAVFESKVREYLLEEHLSRFRTLGWTTFGNLAFASDYVPGQSDGAIFDRDLAVNAFGRADHPDKPKLRRLFVEAYAVAAWDIRRRCESTDSDAPRKLPTQEREVRRERVVARLPGIRVVGEMEPSYRLQDLCFEIWDTNVVKHVTWEQATKRESELHGVKTERAWHVDASGFLKETETLEPASADVRSDLRLLWAMRRRGIAFEMADLASYETMEAASDRLLAAYLETPIEGFARVSLDQLFRADQFLFSKLSELCRHGVRRGADGRRPFDIHVPAILESPRFQYLITGLPVGNASSRGSPVSDSTATEPKKRSALEQANRDLRNESKRLRSMAASSDSSHSQWQPSGGGRGGKGSGKHGGKGQGKSKRRPTMPAALSGKNFQSESGEPICFAFNLPGGCTQAKPGSRCSRGMHICAEPGCGGHHSLQHHSSK
jgi:hypothetical protein